MISRLRSFDWDWNIRSTRFAYRNPSVSGAAGEMYLYGPENLRMYRRKSDGTEELHVYGAHGERLGVHPILPIPPTGGAHPYYVGVGTTVLYFAGRLYGTPDRLGSTDYFYPYGEEYTVTSQNREKFATYFGMWRDWI